MINGTYNDGRQAKTFNAFVQISDDMLMITDAKTGHLYACWKLVDIHLVGNPTDGQVARLRHATGDDRLTLNPDEALTPFEAACPNLRRYNHHEGKKGRTSLLIWASSAIASVIVLIFVVIPQLSGVIAERIPQKWEDRLSASSAQQIKSILARIENKNANDLVCKNAAANADLDRITRQLAPNHQISIEVLDLKMANAFAIPGERVFILRGLIDEAANANEVIGVLAHEIAHVRYRHPLTLLVQATGTSLLFGLVFGDVFGGSIIAGLGQALVSSAYGRQAETEADIWAVERMNALGFDVSPLADFFDRLDEKQGATENAMQYLSSHPTSRDRAARIRDEGTGRQLALTDAQWQNLQAICK